MSDGIKRMHEDMEERNHQIDILKQARIEDILAELKSRGSNLGPLAEAGLLAIKKGGDYNDGHSRDEYFPLGLSSYAQMLHIKCTRLLSFARNPREANFEGERDTLLDLINYSSFAIDWLDRSKKG